MSLFILVYELLMIVLINDSVFILYHNNKGYIYIYTDYRYQFGNYIIIITVKYTFFII